ncbi:diacylglycerol/lipid kinase family protein [Stomatohabitans albus]|uniref:diacylglycerol/lipid kinase family protein n=1 Tax=Stomatohabitans albus TaxID=3110766 RepID=UPI00300CAEA3
MTIHLLVNPAAGRGRSMAMSTRVGRLLGADTKVHISPSLDEAVALAGTFGPDDTVAVLGGDGMVAAIAGQAVQTQSLFLPLPGGSGNDVCRALGMGTDPIAVAKRARHYHERPMDVISADNRIVTCAVSYALIAQTAHLANTSPGFFPAGTQYMWGLAMSMFTTAPRVRITTDQGVVVNGRTWLATLSNLPNLGNGLTVCPPARIDDGLMDLLWTDPLPKASLLSALWRIPAKKLLEHPSVHHMQVKEAQVQVWHEPASADGEVIRPPKTVKVLPHALRVLAPRKQRS